MANIIFFIVFRFEGEPVEICRGHIHTKITILYCIYYRPDNLFCFVNITRAVYKKRLRRKSVTAQSLIRDFISACLRRQLLFYNHFPDRTVRHSYDMHSFGSFRDLASVDIEVFYSLDVIVCTDSFDA